MNMTQLKELVSLDKEKADLDARLDDVKTRIDELKQMLLPQFLTAGMRQTRIDGRLVSLVQDIFASPAEGVGRPAVAQALKDADLAHFVEENYNTNTIKAYVREIAREIREECLREDRLFNEEALRAGLPEPLRNALKISFLHSLKVLKG